MKAFILLLVVLIGCLAGCAELIDTIDDPFGVKKMSPYDLIPKEKRDALDKALNEKMERDISAEQARKKAQEEAEAKRIADEAKNNERTSVLALVELYDNIQKAALNYQELAKMHVKSAEEKELMVRTAFTIKMLPPNIIPDFGINVNSAKGNYEVMGKIAEFAGLQSEYWVDYYQKNLQLSKEEQDALDAACAEARRTMTEEERDILKQAAAWNEANIKK